MLLSVFLNVSDEYSEKWTMDVHLLQSANMFCEPKFTIMHNDSKLSVKPILHIYNSNF